jgi:hypothetical protein
MNAAIFEIKPFVPRERERTWEPLKLKRAIEAAIDIDLSKETRERKYTEARSVFYFLAQKLTYASLVEIGRHTNRTHATVIHALKQYDALYQYDLRFRKFADDVTAKVMTGI